MMRMHSTPDWRHRFPRVGQDNNIVVQAKAPQGATDFTANIISAEMPTARGCRLRRPSNLEKATPFVGRMRSESFLQGLRSYHFANSHYKLWWRCINHLIKGTSDFGLPRCPLRGLP